MRTLTLAVQVQLSLGWNTYLLFNNDTVSFVWKTDEIEEESIVLLNFCSLAVLESSVDEGWWCGAVSLIYLFPDGHFHI